MINEIATDSLALKRIQLEVTKCCQMYEISQENMGVSFERVVDEMGRRMVAQLVIKVASKKYDSATVMYPSTWWDAFKKAFFPVWAVRRWPVKHDKFTFEANAYYPEIQIPERSAFVEVIVAAHRNSYDYPPAA